MRCPTAQPSAAAPAIANTAMPIRSGAGSGTARPTPLTTVLYVDVDQSLQPDNRDTKRKPVFEPPVSKRNPVPCSAFVALDSGVCIGNPVRHHGVSYHKPHTTVSNLSPTQAKRRAQSCCPANPASPRAPREFRPPPTPKRRGGKHHDCNAKSAAATKACEGGPAEARAQDRRRARAMQHHLRERLERRVLVASRTRVLPAHVNDHLDRRRVIDHVPHTWSE